MANWYVSSVLHAAVPVWQANHAYNVGNIVRQAATPTQGNERCFRVSSKSGTGTSGASEPSWTLTKNGTTTDNAGANQLVWTECTGQEAYQSAGNWTAPAASLDLIWGSWAAIGLSVSEDNVFCDKNHVEPTWTGTRNYSNIGTTQVVTVSGSTLPPTAEHAATGATYNTSGVGSPTFAGFFSVSGITFNLGSGSSNAFMQFSNGSGEATGQFKNCPVVFNTTSASSRIWIGSTSIASVHFGNCPVTFGNAGQGFYFGAARSSFIWTNTPNAVNGTSPSALIQRNASVEAQAEIIGVDLSGLTGQIYDNSTGSIFFRGRILVSGCKLNAATVLSNNMRTASRHHQLAMVGCDDTTGNFIARQAYGTPNSSTGWLSTTSLYRTGGASADGVPYGLIMWSDSTAVGLPRAGHHPVSPPLLFWNDTSGVSKTVTVHALIWPTAAQSENELWLDVSYFGSSASPVLSLATSGANAVVAKASPNGLTGTTEKWDDGVTARANSGVYTRGQAIKVASNPNRVFFCETGGTASGSEPAGYATAVDGDQVSDGATAKFRAARRVKISLTFTPQRKGWFAAYLHVVDVKAASNNTSVILDPIVEVS